VDLAVRAMHLGARDFLTKPVTMEQVSTRLDQLRVERLDQPGGAEPGAADDFVALAESSQTLLRTLERAADVPSPVWIEGELGSGRMFCARTVHNLASDKTRHWHVWNLLREDPWPSIGTLVLPNVDDLPEDLQRGLHRRLQHVPEGVRLIATARPDGRRRIADGELRPELYYQLAVVVVQVPPLRRRPEDIVPLFRRGLRQFSERYARSEPEISSRFRDQLLRHYWPGNIRELLNLAERTAVMGEDSFQLEVIEDPGGGIPKLEPGFSLSDYLEGVERKILMEALRRTAGDRAAAGKLLGVERNTLRYKLNKYGLLDR
jgi:DNA-binding NtrC family response regulator